jgi:hypothetical protein
LENIVDTALWTIPAPDEILKETIKNLNLQPKEVTENFGKYALKLEETAFGRYLEYEEKALEKLVGLWVKENLKYINKLVEEKGVEKGITEILQKIAPFIKKFEFRAGNMRKARGGMTFQKSLKYLLELVGVPCEEPHGEMRKILKRIDLVSPNADVAKRRPDKAVFLATKRTLAERWKQVVSEHRKGARLYLITVDDDISSEKADEIGNAGIVVYIKDKVKDHPHLKDKDWIRKLSDLPKDMG